eukprot:evm.model.scf_1965.3 EVM.evm.TU.scf_1965.3   scf_1965:22695-23532(+)
MAELGVAVPFTGMWFAGPQEEATFCAVYAASHFRPVDRLYHRLGSLVTLTYAWARVRSRGGLSSDGISAAIIFLTGAALDWLWWAWRVDARPGLRMRMAIAVRLAMGTLPVAAFVPLWVRDPPVVPFSIFHFLILKTGILPLIYVSFAIPMMTRHHLSVHLPTVAFMALNAPRWGCSEGAISPQDSPHLEAAWRWLNALCTGGVGSTTTPPVQRCCLDVVVLSYAVLAFCAPSYVLWASEFAARARFAPAASPRLTWGTMVAHGVLFAIAVCGLWVALH